MKRFLLRMLRKQIISTIKSSDTQQKLANAIASKIDIPGLNELEERKVISGILDKVTDTVVEIF